MSIIRCSKHGEKGFCLRLSKQIVDTIKSDSVICDSHLSLFHISLVDDEDGAELFVETYLLLKEEFDHLNLPTTVSIDTEEAYDYHRALLPKLAGVCAECVREYKQKHGVSMQGFY